MAATGGAAWLEGLLQAELGPGAALGTLTFEGRRLRIEGARVPLGQGAALAVAHAVVELGAGPPLGPLPISARLVSLRGALHVRRRAVPLDFEATPAERPAWVHGTLRARPPTGDAGGAAPEPSTTTSLAVAVVVAPGAGGRIALELALATERSRVILTGAVDAAADLHDTRITGRLACADALPFFPEFAPRPVATFELDLTAEGALADPTLRGRVASASILVAPLHLENVSATLDLDLRRLRYRNLAGEARGGRFAGWGAIPLAALRQDASPLAALRIEDADERLLLALATLGGVPLPEKLPFPRGLRVTGEVMVDAGTMGTSPPNPGTMGTSPPNPGTMGTSPPNPGPAVSGAFAIETPRSALLLRLAVGPAGELLGSTLRGRLSAIEAFPFVSRIHEPVRPGRATVVDLDLRLTGTLARPGIAGRVTSSRAFVEVHDALVVELEDVSAVIDADPDRVVWQPLTGRLCGGTFSSSGRVAIGRRGGTLHADLAWRGVRVQDLPTGRSGERGLAPVVRGVFSGELRFERRGLSKDDLGAHGTLTITGPVYRFVRALEPTLTGYGLPPIQPRGARPLTAAVRTDRGEIIVEPLSAAVEAAEVDGELRLDLDGRLNGRMQVHLHESYLAASPILAVPAALMGKVTIPVDLGGTLADPELKTDALEILDGLLARRGRPGVGDALRGMIDSLKSVTRPRRLRR